MHLLSGSGARANADAESYQQQLDSIMAVARRRELESPSPERRPLPDDCPSTGEGFVWKTHDGPEESHAAPPRWTTNRRLAHAYWRPVLFLVVAALFIASMWEPAKNSTSRGLSTWTFYRELGRFAVCGRRCAMLSNNAVSLSTRVAFKR